MKRQYRPYWLWEDWKAGMWRPSMPVEEEREMLTKAIAFTGDYQRYGSFMLRVVQEWPHSSSHNLTENSMNRRAWVGHAATAMAIECPEYITRRAWWMLTQQQRDDADRMAENAILEFEKSMDRQMRLYQ